jgi:hypothetical protein
MKKIIALGIVFLSSFTVAYAAVPIPGAVADVSSLAALLTDYFNIAVTIMLAAAVVFVVWSGLKFVMSGGDEEKRKEGQSGIIYGIIGIAVMLSVWGLVALVTGSTGLGTKRGGITAPRVD